MFAGEATHPTQAGMTHGAFEEGCRAARWAHAAGHRRVAVVGAGFAGLGAARQLVRNGAEVVVFEARPRLGGRVHTHTLASGVNVELGANWLQQGERNTLAPLVEHLGVATVATDFNAPLDLECGIGARPVHSHSVIQAVRDSFARHDDSVSMAEALADQHALPDLQRVVDLEVVLDAGAPLDDLSARYGFELGVGQGDRWIVGGYGQLLHHLAEGVEVRLSSVIDDVNMRGGEVQLTLLDGACQSFDAAIITVPIAVLKAGAINFQPALPDTHQRSLDHLTAGRVEKVALRFERRWWPRSPSSYLRIASGRAGSVSEWLDLTDQVGEPVITAIFVGDWVNEMWDGHDDRSVAHAASHVLGSTLSNSSDPN
jgi:monoamine oxidase